MNFFPLKRRTFWVVRGVSIYLAQIVALETVCLVFHLAVFGKLSYLSSFRDLRPYLEIEVVPLAIFVLLGPRLKWSLANAFNRKKAN